MYRLPEELPRLISQEEADWLYWNAKDKHVTEMGAYFGASSRAMLDGGATSLDVYDRFIWNYWMKNHDYYKINLHDGQSFLGRYMDNVRYHERRDRIRLNPGDVCSYVPDGRIIDILYLDILKSIPILEHILKHWIPYLEPGAVIVEQDWTFAPLFMVHKFIAFWLMDGYVKMKEQVGTSAVFTVRQKVPKLMFENVGGMFWLKFTKSDIEKALNYANLP